MMTRVDFPIVLFSIV